MSKLTDKIEELTKTREGFDPSELLAAPGNIRAEYQSGRRILIEMYGERITGTVSMTTGTRPALLLIQRRDSIGSPHLIGANTKLLAVQGSDGKYYTYTDKMIDGVKVGRELTRVMTTPRFISA